MNPMWLIDFYKVGHVSQYPEDTTQVWSNWTPRSARVPCPDGVIFFGLQYFIKEILTKEWNDNFFAVPFRTILKEYKEIIKVTLGIENPRTDHIEKLWWLGELPIDIWALPEGSLTSLKVPQLVITNTTPDSFWLPNYLETILSNILWKGCTSATTARRYRQIFKKYALEAGEIDLGFIDWMGHDFSFRGMAGREDAMLSGMGHLLSFSGTDTIPAILAAKEYYGADYSVGGSVAATEHSVMCAGEKDSELETFERLLTKVYPEGIVSIVSDTWDLWKVLTEYIPALKETILNRNGKLVIRPDSGDPVLIMCGAATIPEPAGEEPSLYAATALGVLRLLAQKMGTDGKGHINKAGAIYGDSITPERAELIIQRTVRELKLSPYNVVLGIGSYTYEYVTRDTYGFAMKATAVKRNGQIIDIFKKPVTDSGMKDSLKGIPAVYRTETSTDENPVYYATDGNKPEALDNCAFQKVFSNGELLIDQNFSDIRIRARS